MKRIKKMPRPEASGRRRKGMHVSRVRGAQTPAERINAARDYLLAQLKNVGPDAAENTSTRIAQVMCGAAEALEASRTSDRKVRA